MPKIQIYILADSLLPTMVWRLLIPHGKLLHSRVSSQIIICVNLSTGIQQQPRHFGMPLLQSPSQRHPSNQCPLPQSPSYVLDLCELKRMSRLGIEQWHIF